MCSNRECKQHIFELRTVADVMNCHETSCPRYENIGDKARMSKTGYVPHHHIAGEIVTGVLRNRSSCSLTPEERNEVLNPSMVDVRIGMVDACAWIDGKMFDHVFVHENLQIDTNRSECSNDDICADTSLNRHITARVS